MQVIQDIDSNRGRGGYTGKGGDEVDRCASNMVMKIPHNFFSSYKIVQSFILPVYCIV